MPNMTNFETWDSVIGSIVFTWNQNAKKIFVFLVFYTVNYDKAVLATPWQFMILVFINKIIAIFCENFLW